MSAHENEIQIETAWGSLLDPNVAVVARAVKPEAGDAREYCGDDRLLILDGVFSPAECSRLLTAAEAVGFGRTSYPKAYRGNLRLITVDTSLAEIVWARLRHAVPATVDVEDATYDAVGLNECWRLAKYQVGDRFGAHCDACFEREPGVELSLYTVNIYMNEVPSHSGGATRFYPERALSGSRLALKEDPVLSIAPEAGLAVLFRQPPGVMLLHDGEEVRSGLKFLFRSDVMYRRRGASGAA